MKPFKKEYPIELYQFWGPRYIPEKPFQITLNAPTNNMGLLHSIVLSTEENEKNMRSMEPASYTPKIIDDSTSKQNMGFGNQSREFKCVKIISDTKNKDNEKDTFKSDKSED